jgi:hypothetical protein
MLHQTTIPHCMARRAPSTTGRALEAATDPRMTRWSIQVVIAVGFILEAVISVVVTEASPGLIPMSVVAWLLQWGITWLTYRAFLSRPWWRRHMWLSSGVILIIISVVAMGTVNAFPGWSGTDGWTVMWRFAVTLLATGLVIAVSNYRDDILRERSIQDRLQRTRAERISVVREMRDDVVARLLAMLQQAFDATSHDGAGAQRLARFAREQVRPLSHELAEAMPPLTRRESTSVDRYSWREALGDVTSKPLVRPWPMAIAVTILFIFATVETTTVDAPVGDVGGPGLTVSVDLSTFIVGMGALAVVFMATWVGAFIAMRLTTPILPTLGLAARVTLAIATVLSIGVLVVLVVQGVVTVTATEGDEPGTLLRRLWISVPIVAIAFAVVIARSISGLLRESARRVHELTQQLEWESTRVVNALNQERQFFATQLHGPIQSAAAAAALRLESSEASPEALEQVRTDLSGAIQALGQGPPDRRDVGEELRKLADTWAGVCEVHVDVPDSIVESLDADWVASGTVLDLLVDAVANAVMHGDAAHVWIGAEWVADGEVEITVVNDGGAELGEGRGLGSALLDSTCVRWSRHQVADGVRLDAVVAVPHGVLLVHG